MQQAIRPAGRAGSRREQEEQARQAERDKAKAERERARRVRDEARERYQGLTKAELADKLAGALPGEDRQRRRTGGTPGVRGHQLSCGVPPRPERRARRLSGLAGVLSGAAMLGVPAAFAIERVLHRDGLRVAEGLFAAIVGMVLSFALGEWILAARARRTCACC